MHKDSRRLLTHLTAENRAILAGDYAGLYALAAAKESLFDRWRAHGADLPKVQAAMERNHELVSQARAGMQAVVGLLSEIRTQRAGFGTYGKDGSHAVHRAPRPSFEKRA